MALSVSNSCDQLMIKRHRKPTGICGETWLTWATFSPMFDVCMAPWKYFADPLSCKENWNTKYRGWDWKLYFPKKLYLYLLQKRYWFLTLEDYREWNFTLCEFCLNIIPLTLLSQIIFPTFHRGEVLKFSTLSIDLKLSFGIITMGFFFVLKLNMVFKS